MQRIRYVEVLVIDIGGTRVKFRLSGSDEVRRFRFGPVRLINDALLQALGAYRSGRMLFVGLGTGVVGGVRRAARRRAARVWRVVR